MFRDIFNFKAPDRVKLAPASFFHKLRNRTYTYEDVDDLYVKLMKEELLTKEKTIVIDKLYKEIAEKTQAIIDYVDTITDKDSIILKHLDVAAKLRGYLSENSKVLEANQIEIKELSESLQAANVNVSTLENKVNDLYSDKAILLEEIKVLRKEYSEFRDSSNTLIAKYKTQHKDKAVNSSYQSKIKAVELTNSILSDEIAAMRADKTKDKEIKRLRGELEELSGVKADNIQLLIELDKCKNEKYICPDQPKEVVYVNEPGVRAMTCDEIKKARQRHGDGMTIEELAHELSVSRSSLSRALHCETYQDCCKRDGIPYEVGCKKSTTPIEHEKGESL